MTLPLSQAPTLPSRFYLDPEVLEREKELVCGRMWQLMLGSRSYDTGRFSTRRENGVSHFQNLVLEFLRGTE